MRQYGFFSQLCGKFFTFSGRLNRKPYILRSLAATFLPVALALVLFIVFAGGAPLALTGTETIPSVMIMKKWKILRIT